MMPRTQRPQDFKPSSSSSSSLPSSSSPSSPWATLFGGGGSGGGGGNAKPRNREYYRDKSSKLSRSRDAYSLNRLLNCKVCGVRCSWFTLSVVFVILSYSALAWYLISSHEESKSPFANGGHHDTVNSGNRGNSGKGKGRDTESGVGGAIPGMVRRNMGNLFNRGSNSRFPPSNAQHSALGQRGLRGDEPSNTHNGKVGVVSDHRGEVEGDANGEGEEEEGESEDEGSGFAKLAKQADKWKKKDDPPRRQFDQAKDNEDIHIVFSTGCNLFQHWQAEVLLHSHMTSGQPGKITRIVSGCESEHEKRQHHKYMTHPAGLGDLPVPEEMLKKSSNPRMNLHITPAFEGAKEFPWINKPMGIHHWLTHADVDETAIVIIDPDMFFLDTITQDGSKTLENGKVQCTMGCKGNRWNGRPINPSDITEVVRRGRPVAQLYGLGGTWVNRFDVPGIAGKDSPALKWDTSSGGQHFSAGPPYIIHVDDMRAIMPLWVKFMKPVFDAYPGDIQADMYAYILAAAHLDLPHLLLDHFMVSSPGIGGEGWKYIEQWPEVDCRHPYPPPGYQAPTFQHIAQRYDVAPWMFHKGHVPANILSCELPILKMPPRNLYNDITNKFAVSKRDAHRAFMVCSAHYQLNRALIDWKEKYCEDNVPGENGGDQSSNTSPGANNLKLNKNLRRQFMLQMKFRACKGESIDGQNCWVFAKVEPDEQID